MSNTESSADDLRTASRLNADALRLVAEGKPEQALVNLNQAMQLAPNLAESYLNRAEIFANMGLSEKAASDRQQASQLRGRSQMPLGLRAVLAGVIVFVVAFAAIFAVGAPVWTIIIPIALGLVAGRAVASQRSK